MRLSTSFTFKVFLPMLFIAAFSCKEQDTYIEKPVSLNLKPLVLDTSYIIIPIKKKLVFLYKMFSVTKDGVFCGYNNKEHSLDLYSLTEQKSLFQIQLPKSGVNSIRQVMSVYIHNIDSFFVLGKAQITLFNSKGTVLKNIMINTRNSFFKENYFIEYDFGNNFSYNSKDKKILITNINPSANVDSKARFLTSFISEIDIENSKDIRLLRVKYSALYLKNYYGFMTGPQFSRSIDGKAIIYNFPIEPNIYKYDMGLGKTEVIGGKPDSIGMGNNFIAAPLNQSDSKNNDKKLLHYIENCVYYKVIPDKKSNFYFRIHSASIQYMTDTEEVNDLNNKKRYLSIFDNNFNLISTLDLNDRNYVLQGAFTTNDGLYLPVPETENCINFKLFKFKYQ